MQEKAAPDEGEPRKEKLLMKHLTPRDLTLSALFTAVTAVLSQIVIPMPLVPFNLAVLAVFLCGALQKKGAALLSQLGYLLLGAAGVPVFAQFTAGPATLFGVTGGYLMAYPVMAWLVAWLVEKDGWGSFWGRIGAMAVSLIPCYLFGTVWFAVYLHESFANAALAACLPFIPADLAKAFAASYVSLAVQQRMKGAAA